MSLSCLHGRICEKVGSYQCSQNAHTSVLLPVFIFLVEDDILTSLHDLLLSAIFTKPQLRSQKPLTLYHIFPAFSTVFLHYLHKYIYKAQKGPVRVDNLCDLKPYRGSPNGSPPPRKAVIIILKAENYSSSGSSVSSCSPRAARIISSSSTSSSLRIRSQ